jgi:hypothetical protein
MRQGFDRSLSGRFRRDQRVSELIIKPSPHGGDLARGQAAIDHHNLDIARRAQQFRCIAGVDPLP